MKAYTERSDLHVGENFIAFQAKSQLYKKEVIVKEYQFNDIYSSEGLLREATRQAREKPRESAVLIGVSLEPVRKYRKPVLSATCWRRRTEI